MQTPLTPKLDSYGDRNKLVITTVYGIGKPHAAPELSTEIRHCKTKNETHRRDAEGAEKPREKRGRGDIKSLSLRPLCDLCVSAVKNFTMPKIRREESRMKTLFWWNLILVCLVASICFAVCSEVPGEPEEESEIVNDTPANIGIISDDTPFDFRLFLQLVNQEGISKNLFISPTSIGIALAMAYNGAQGETKQAMAEVLGITGMTLQEVNQANALLINALDNLDEKVQLDIANSLWAKEGMEFLPSFIKHNEDFYGAEVTNLDFSDPGAPDTINTWISKETHGKIDRIVNNIDENTALFLINALYFRGTWTKVFDRRKTYEADFTRIDGSKKRVPMMMSRSGYTYHRDKKFEAINLPYGSGRVSMYIFPTRSPAFRSSTEI